MSLASLAPVAASSFSASFLELPAALPPSGPLPVPFRLPGQPFVSLSLT